MSGFLYVFVWVLFYFIIFNYLFVLFSALRHGETWINETETD